MLASSKRFKANSCAGGSKASSEVEGPRGLEEQQEDDQIQCSLPYYLDHWFGQCIRDTSPPTTTAASPPPSAPILDSQGFLTTATTKKATRNTSSPLISISSVPCIDEGADSEKEQPRFSQSPPLFTSPDRSDTSDKDAANHSSSLSRTTSVPDSQPAAEGTSQEATSAKLDIAHACDILKTDFSVSVKEEQVGIKHVGPVCKGPGGSEKSGKKTGRGKRRKRKLSMSTAVDEYRCPLTATTLKDCSLTQKQVTVSVLALILQVNPVMDVHCKAGQTVPKSSLLLADPTKSYFKLSLWRQAAAWVERISAGDVIYFRRIRLKTWRKEVVGTTTMFSSVLNLHQPKKDLPSQVTSEIPKESLDYLLQWAKKRFGYLFQGSLPKSQRVVEFVSSDNLSIHPLVHFRGKLVSMVTDKVLVLADSPERDVYLYLVGIDSTLWSAQLCSNVGKVVEVTYLATSSDSLTQGGSTLHTTSRSQFRSLATDCQLSTDLLKLLPSEGTSSTGLVTGGLSIAQVLLNKSSGVYKLKASAVRIGLCDEVDVCLEQLCDHLSPSLLVEELCQSYIYVGCGGCSKPLTQDENGIYSQCMTCLLTHPKDQRPSFKHYFRLLSVTLSDPSGSGVVIVTHTVSPKVVGVNPVDVVRVRLSKDDEKFTKMKEALCDRLSCLRECKGVWTVSLGVSKDENSFVQSITTSLLDWSCDNHVIT